MLVVWAGLSAYGRFQMHIVSFWACRQSVNSNQQQSKQVEALERGHPQTRRLQSVLNRGTPV